MQCIRCESVHASIDRLRSHSPGLGRWLQTHQADVAGLEHRVYIEAADAAADELGILRPEVEHQANAVLLVQLQLSFVVYMISDDVLFDCHPPAVVRVECDQGRAALISLAVAE